MLVSLNPMTSSQSVHPVSIAAHLNLNTEYLPYKHIIGQVILDVCFLTLRLHLSPSLMLCYAYSQKNNLIKTVVNKLDSIHSQFRFFQMELIAGEPNYVVEHVCTQLYAPLTTFILTSDHRPSQIASLHLISVRCTGTRGCTRSTAVLWTSLSPRTSLRMCLPVSVLSPYQQGRRGAAFSQTTSTRLATITSRSTSIITRCVAKRWKG